MWPLCHLLGEVLTVGFTAVRSLGSIGGSVWGGRGLLCWPAACTYVGGKVAMDQVSGAPYCVTGEGWFGG